MFGKDTQPFARISKLARVAFAFATLPMVAAGCMVTDEDFANSEDELMGIAETTGMSAEQAGFNGDIMMYARIAASSRPYRPHIPRVIFDLSRSKLRGVPA